MAGLVGYVFDLISEFTSFLPQTDRVYLFLAAALFFLQKYLVVAVV